MFSTHYLSFSHSFQSGPATSGALRGATVSLTLLFAALSLFFFPKSRHATALLVVVLFVGYIAAAPALTIRVGLPPQVTKVCINGNCINPFNSSSTGSPSGSTGSPTNSPTGSPTGSTGSPTSAPAGPTSAPTPAPTASLHFNLRALVMAPKPLANYGSSAKSEAAVMG